jgi:predicted RNA-binding Zn ribbon-like protein
VEISDHWVSYVRGSFALANAFGPGVAHGRPHRPPTGEAAVGAAIDALTHAMRNLPRLTLADACTLGATGREIWLILRAVAAGEASAATEALNDLLTRVDPRPRMVPHGPAGNWHLHFTTPSDDEGLLWSSNLAVATAMFLGSADFVRSKACQAPNCDRVFLDATRNQSQQFCSTRCQERVKSAAHRRRRQSRPAAAR